ncbi:MAG: helix-turn-helix domain-containing protein, partial [Flavobacteriaceae bacterium]
MLQVSQNIDQKFIDRLQQILEKNLDNEHFGVSDLAMAANVSRSNLHRKVHAYNGNSTSQFIREYRLKKAMELLKKHDLTVAEIAYRVGFSSPTYFSSCFKDYYGYPPGEAKTIYQHTSAKNTSGARINNKYRALNSRWIIGLITALILIAVLSTSYYIRTDQSEDLMQTEYRAGEKTIAVLPLKNWSGDPNLEYIGDGMTDAVINRLTKISSISNVIPFTSVIQYKNSEKSVDKIADELGVNYILQGNFQLS